MTFRPKDYREVAKPLGEMGTPNQGEPQKVMKSGKIVRRDSLHGSRCSLTLLCLKLTVVGLFP